MKRRIFNKDDQDDFFSKNGYYHISGFLNERDVEEMRKLYFDIEYTNQVNGFHRTLDMQNPDIKRKIYREIDRLVSERSKPLLYNYKYFLTSFMTKEPGADAFDIHQNWSFVEEDKFASLVLWIPLQDTDQRNGTMEVIPGSNNYPKWKRGNNIKWKYEDIKSELIESYLEAIDMKAGDAIIFDDATIHYTSPNNSKEPRIAIAQVMIPEESQPIFYNYNEVEHVVEKYRIDKDFYHNYVERYIPEMNFKKDCELLESSQLEMEQVSKEEFDTMFRNFRNR